MEANGTLEHLTRTPPILFPRLKHFSFLSGHLFALSNPCLRITRAAEPLTDITFIQYVNKYNMIE